MSETQALFAALRETADASTAAAIERLIKSGADRHLVRINVLAFAAGCGLKEEHTIAAFLRRSESWAFVWLESEHPSRPDGCLLSQMR